MYRPKFSISSQILKNTSRIEAAKALIENAPLIPSFERRFKRDALIRAAHHSTHIEGNLLPFTQVKKVLDGRGREIPARERDVQEVINYRKVMVFVDELARRKGGKTAVGRGLLGFTERDVLRIHRLVVERLISPNEAGRYRRVQVAIRNSRTGRVTFYPPKPEAVRAQVLNFFKWLNAVKGGKLHPILKAGIIHAEMTRIHPFVEGNGRTARVLATLSLYLDGYDIKRFFCLDEYYDRDAPAYFRAIQTYKKANDDLTLWLEYFTAGLAIEMGRVKERVLKLSRDTKVRKAAGQIALSERQEVLVDFIQDYGRVTNADFKKLFPHLSDDTVLRELKDLIEKGIVVKRGKTKGAGYELK